MVVPHGGEVVWRARQHYVSVLALATCYRPMRGLEDGFADEAGVPGLHHIRFLPDS